MAAILAVFVCLFAFPSLVSAAPISVGGFTFDQGEQAFADDAFVVSGTVTGASAEQVRNTLVGSNMGDSVRVITPDVAVIEIVFSDNAISNLSGTDLVLFELSGSGLATGTPDPSEKFEFSVFDGSAFSAFVEVIPVNTGFVAPHDATLSIYAVEVDLQDFGFLPGETVERVRIRLVDNLVTRSADPTGFGALHSVPEPSGALLLAGGLAGLARYKKSRRFRDKR